VFRGRDEILGVDARAGILHRDEQGDIVEAAGDPTGHDAAYDW
jgi:hypothetical protein